MNELVSLVMMGTVLVIVSGIPGLVRFVRLASLQFRRDFRAAMARDTNDKIGAAMHRHPAGKGRSIA